MSSSHGYAIELNFDTALDNQVLIAWNVLARRQITTHLIDIQSRPHITLFYSSTTPSLPIRSNLITLLKRFATDNQPFSLSFSSIGTFPNDNNNILFLSPTPSVSLLRFQSELCDAVKNVASADAEYCSDSWIPYCSVAEGIPETKMAEAFSVLRDLKLTVEGNAEDVCLVEFSPVRREMFLCNLGNGNNVVYSPIRSEPFDFP